MIDGDQVTDLTRPIVTVIFTSTPRGKGARPLGAFQSSTVLWNLERELLWVRRLLCGRGSCVRNLLCGEEHVLTD